MVGNLKRQLMAWAVITLAVGAGVPGRTLAQAAADREGVRQAVLDYVEGVYNVDPARIERSVHPNLAKLGYYRGPNDAAYGDAIPMTFERLKEVARNYNRNGHVPKDAPKQIDIYEVLDKTATVKLTAHWGVDYMHLVKLDGKWMIVNVLWQSHPRGTNP